MGGFNLSEWSLKHRSIAIYLMIVAVAAGVLSFINLGRSEDPTFVIKTMVVQAAWPGATIDDTLKQVTERLERKLQETPQLDFIRSFTRAGLTTIFVNLKGSATAKEVPDIWYHVRKSIGDIRPTLPAGVIGPGFNDDFGDTFGIIYGFTADGFTHRELRDYVEDVRSQLLERARRVQDRDSRRAGRTDLRRVLEPGARDPRHRPQRRDRRAPGAERGAAGRLDPDRRRDPVGARVSGSFESEQDLLATNFNVGGRLVRLGDIATVRRGFADPPQPMFRVNGEPAIGLAIAMRDGGDILALGKNLDKAMAAATANLPVGIHPLLVSDQAVTVKTAISEFMESLWQAVAIILVGQLHRARRAAGAGRGAGDPADAGDRLLGDGPRPHRHAAHLARRADHRAGAARRRRDDDDRRDARRGCAPATPSSRPRRSPSAPTPSRCWRARWSRSPDSFR